MLGMAATTAKGQTHGSPVTQNYSTSQMRILKRKNRFELLTKYHLKLYSETVVYSPAKEAGFIRK